MAFYWNIITLKYVQLVLLKNKRNYREVDCDYPRWWDSAEIFLINEKFNYLFILPTFVIPFKKMTTQVGFAESNNTADNRANIGGTIIGAPIVGQ